MTAKSQILATIVGFIVIFLLGWLLYGILLMDFYAANSGAATNVSRSEDEMVWWALILGNLLQTYFLVFVFSRWAGISTFSGGLKGGLIIGFLIGLAFNLTMFGTTNLMNLTAVIVDPFVSAIMMGITGGVVGMMLGRN
jgi:hypothetical protein